MSDYTEIDRYALPIIESTSLKSFDLYRKNPNASVKIDRNVFCLIGANGLGKSTFLNTMIYGITGGIPYRVHEFTSPREYAEEANRLDRREEYFRGRLSVNSIEHASVTIALKWPSITILICRRLFGTGAVQSVEIKYADERVKSELYDGSNAAKKYEELVVEYSKVPNFEQFIFLIHYVCSFDEDRHLLLWESSALTNALYLAFGSDAEQAEIANKLKRDVQRLGSKARNSAYAAKQSRDEKERLTNIIRGDADQSVDSTTLKTFAALNRRIDETNERVRRREIELRKSEAIVSDKSASLAELQLEYDETFARRAAAAPTTRFHPLIRSTISNDKCAVCSTTGIGSSVEERVERNICPLCNSEVGPPTDDPETINALKSLDEKIDATRSELRDILNRRKRFQDEYETAVQSEVAARDARDEFLQENPNAEHAALPHETESHLNTVIKQLGDEAERFSAQSKKEYLQRDTARKNLHRIERQLQSAFDAHSEPFVELFRTYAEQFIGLTVDIELDHQKGINDTGFDLQLSLDGQQRIRSDDVSESQRFFLDIALRMALTEFMTSTCASLLIDTPEGSLDITYEARAGLMFSRFAQGGNNILMTANLRSSALLLRLGQIQKNEGMQLSRLTDWASLSEVQREEEGLFIGAYAEIEEAME